MSLVKTMQLRRKLCIVAKYLLDGIDREQAVFIVSLPQSDTFQSVAPWPQLLLSIVLFHHRWCCSLVLMLNCNDCDSCCCYWKNTNTHTQSIRAHGQMGCTDVIAYCIQRFMVKVFLIFSFFWSNPSLFAWNWIGSLLPVNWIAFPLHVQIMDAIVWCLNKRINADEIMLECSC